MKVKTVQIAECIQWFKTRQDGTNNKRRAHLPADKLQFQVHGKHQMARLPAEKLQFQVHGNYSSRFMVNNLGKS